MAHRVDCGSRQMLRFNFLGALCVSLFIHLSFGYALSVLKSSTPISISSSKYSVVPVTLVSLHAPLKPSFKKNHVKEKKHSTLKLENKFIPQEENTSPTSAELQGGIEVLYPESARQKGEEGKVTVHVEIGEEGKVKEVTLVQSSGFKDLDHAALDALKGTLFKPAQANGKNISSQQTLAIRFSLE